MIKDAISPFVGFTFNGKHTSYFNISSVSASGGSYMRNLTGSFTDTRTNIAGRDYSFYFGTDINTKTYTFTLWVNGISFTELSNLKKWLSPRAVGKLILDETPSRFAWCKVGSMISFDVTPKWGKRVGWLKNKGMSDEVAEELWAEYEERSKDEPFLAGWYDRLSPQMEEKPVEEILYYGDISVTFETVGAPYEYSNYTYSSSGSDLIYNDMKALPVFPEDMLWYDTGLLYNDAFTAGGDVVSTQGNTKQFLFYTGEVEIVPNFVFKNLDGLGLKDKSYIRLYNALNGTSILFKYLLGIPTWYDAEMNVLRKIEDNSIVRGGVKQKVLLSPNDLATSVPILGFFRKNIGGSSVSTLFIPYDERIPNGAFINGYLFDNRGQISKMYPDTMPEYRVLKKYTIKINPGYFYDEQNFRIVQENASTVAISRPYYEDIKSSWGYQQNVLYVYAVDPDENYATFLEGATIECSDSGRIFSLVEFVADTEKTLTLEVPYINTFAEEPTAVSIVNLNELQVTGETGQGTSAISNFFTPERVEISFQNKYY